VTACILWPHHHILNEQNTYLLQVCIHSSIYFPRNERDNYLTLQNERDSNLTLQNERIEKLLALEDETIETKLVMYIRMLSVLNMAYSLYAVVWSHKKACSRLGYDTRLIEPQVIQDRISAVYNLSEIYKTIVNFFFLAFQVRILILEAWK